MPEFKDYKAWVQKYVDNHDTREINFQNNVVKRLLEEMYPDYDVVYVDTKGPESKKHDYREYSGEYRSVQGTLKPTTPDLLICKNWDWYNKDNKDITYLATVEVKSPYGPEAVYKTQLDYFKEKIDRHLSAKAIDRVILTDALKWVFYTVTSNVRKPEDVITLVDLVKAGRGYTYKWSENANEQFMLLKEKLEKFLKKQSSHL